MRSPPLQQRLWISWSCAGLQMLYNFQRQYRMPTTASRQRALGQNAQVVRLMYLKQGRKKHAPQHDHWVLSGKELLHRLLRSMANYKPLAPLSSGRPLAISLALYLMELAACQTA